MLAPGSARPAPVRTVAVIPARGGSLGVPGKNLRRVGGVSLVERAVRSCRAASLVDAVFVSTDDSSIAEAAEASGAQVIVRPPALSGDTATSESALLHALDQLARLGVEPDVLTFVQCTSPFVDAEAVDEGVGLVLSGRADSVFAAVPTHDFLWRRDAATDDVALVQGQNHDPAFRPRRQDRQPDYRETGAFYVMAVEGFRRHRHRFFGRTAPVAVPPLTAVDIDEEHDLVLANAVAGLLPVETKVGVDVVITDFDGVHTDDTALVDQDGRESVQVSRADGLGVQRLLACGVPMLIVSKERNPVVTARADKLGVEVLQAVDDKVVAVRGWLQRTGITADRTAYLGNDLNDLAVMALVGWPIAVADAHPEVRRAARLTLSRPGGRGAVRELCDLVLAQRSGPAATAVGGPDAAVARPAPAPGAAAADAGRLAPTQ
jgi:YrbI family 3-deoxy-D-manno-octulosonate 8-phosphate phosphatase